MARWTIYRVVTLPGRWPDSPARVNRERLEVIQCPGLTRAQLVAACRHPGLRLEVRSTASEEAAGNLYDRLLRQMQERSR